MLFSADISGTAGCWRKRDHFLISCCSVRDASICCLPAVPSASHKAQLHWNTYIASVSLVLDIAIGDVGDRKLLVSRNGSGGAHNDDIANPQPVTVGQTRVIEERGRKPETEMLIRSSVHCLRRSFGSMLWLGSRASCWYAAGPGNTVCAFRLMMRRACRLSNTAPCFSCDRWSSVQARYLGSRPLRVSDLQDG